MKKILLSMLMLSISVFAADGKSLTTKCVACHGSTFEKQALGKSAVVNKMTEKDIVTALKGYKAGALNKYGMGSIMKGQVSTMSDKDMETVAKYIKGGK